MRRRAGSPAIRVAIIGAGFSGIAAAHYLRLAGIEDVSIFDRAKDVGGTWFQNTYPGAGCDTPSHQYSFSFVKWDWSRTHALQPEIHRYFHHAIESEHLSDALRLGVEVRSVKWDDQIFGYRLTMDDGTVEQFDAVVSAVGFLNVAARPSWPGMEKFRGRVVHSSEWAEHVDVSAQRVAIVGTGSSAAQIAPAIAPDVEKLLIFQRAAGWILPKLERDFGPAERVRLRKFRGSLLRAQLFYQNDRALLGGRHARSGAGRNRARKAIAQGFIERELESRPDLVALVTPSHEYSGKRAVRSDTFYKTLLRSNTTLVPHAVASLTEHGVIDDVGVEHEVDTVVLATGFQASTYLNGLEVVGRENRDLHDAWAGEPSALLGISVPNFPNFFMMYGPNTNGGPLVFLLETQAKSIASALRAASRRGAVIDTKPVAFSLYNRWLQSKLAKTVWVSTENYYKSASGRIVTQWPVTATFYRVLVMTVGRLGRKFIPRSTNPATDQR